MKSPVWFRGAVAAAVASLLVAYMLVCLEACDSGLLAGGSTSTETGEPVSLTGRVVAENGKSVSGIVVLLAGKGYTDTTDEHGRYRIVRPPTTGLAAPRLGKVVDTLLFVQYGQRIASRAVSRWVDTLPNVQLVQRGFAGDLDTYGATVTRIEALVSGDGIPDGQPVVSEFFYNALAFDYSGFVYFPPPNGVQHYSVMIQVYGNGGQLIGRSANVPFTSQAGNVTIPRFEANTFLP